MKALKDLGKIAGNTVNTFGIMGDDMLSYATAVGDAVKSAGADISAGFEQSRGTVGRQNGALLGPVTDKVANDYANMSMGDRLYAPVKTALGQTAPSAQPAKPNFVQAPGGQQQAIDETVQPQNPAQSLVDVFGKHGLNYAIAKFGPDFVQRHIDNAAELKAGKGASGSSGTDYGTQLFNDLMVENFKAASIGDSPERAAMRLTTAQQSLGLPPDLDWQGMSNFVNTTARNPQMAALLRQDLWTKYKAENPDTEKKADGGVVGMGMESPVGQPEVAMDSGDYVIPADVLRFYGTKFFQSLIEKVDQV